MSVFEKLTNIKNYALLFLGLTSGVAATTLSGCDSKKSNNQETVKPDSTVDYNEPTIQDLEKARRKYQWEHRDTSKKQVDTTTVKNQKGNAIPATLTSKQLINN